LRVRVPATVANLGPGFDVLAMAVDIWLEVEAEPASRPDWRFQGEGASWLPSIATPFTGLAMRGTVRSSIPVGVGLGSSAAARLAACALRGVARERLLEAMAVEEGHIDNAAAALEGGMVAVAGTRAYALPAPDLEVALFLAAEPLPTQQARALLDEQVSRADAVFNSARTALFAHALHSRGWDLLQEAMRDRLHQPQRTSLYPWLPAVLEAALSEGAHGAALAGAGPSVFAFCEGGQGSRVAEAMSAAAGVPGAPTVTRVVGRGMEVAA
jgi:homoserine kinase